MKLRSILFILVILAATLTLPGIKTLSAQKLERLPNDPRILSGRLDNGLSYIIVKSNSQKGYANFCMAQKSGYSLEGENERGMSLMLESLSLMGTRNFADSSIVRYLNSIGVPERNITFHTGADNLVYSIGEVPVKGGAIDSSLLIIYNWLSSLNLDEADITEEMTFLKSRISKEWNSPEKRLNYNLLKSLFPKSPYARSQSITDATDFKSFSSKDLRSFYYKWYRPDLQAVIVVGDVEPKEIENKIKSIFSTIPKAQKPAPRRWYTPAGKRDRNVLLLQDREYITTSLRMDIFEPALPTSYKATTAPFIEEYLKGSLAEYLKSNLRERSLKDNLPIFNIDVNWGLFMEMERVQSFTITLETIPQALYSTASFLNSTIEQILAQGFTNADVERFREQYMRNLEALYNNRANLPNNIYIRRALNSFLHGESLASIELKYEFMQEAIQSISAADFNNYAQQLLGKREQRTLACFMPYSKGMEQISVERLESAFSSLVPLSPLASKKTAAAENDNIWPQYIPAAKAGTIISESDDEEFNIHTITLSNGATLLLKQNYAARDTISLRAIGNGGFSLLQGNSMEMNQIMNEVLNLNGVGNLDKPAMEGLFDYYNMGLKSSIGDCSHQIEGYTVKENLERLFQLVAISFSQPYRNEALFENYRKEKVSRREFRNISPEEKFGDSCAFYNNSNKAYVTPLSTGKIAALHYNDIMRNYKRLFSNAADFLFIISGDINTLLPQIREYAIKYISTLPGNINARESWHTLPNYLAKGSISRSFLTNMEIPKRRASITWSLGMDYSVHNKALCQLVKQMMERIVSKGAVKRSANSLSLTHQLLFYPESIALFKLNYVADKELSNLILSGIVTELERVAKNGLSQEEFDLLRKSVADLHIEESKLNSYWLDIFSNSYLSKTNLDFGYMNTLQDITKEEFCSFVQNFVEHCNKIEVVMDGTREDVESSTLLRENQFIRNFFNL